MVSRLGSFFRKKSGEFESPLSADASEKANLALGFGLFIVLCSCGAENRLHLLPGASERSASIGLLSYFTLVRATGWLLQRSAFSFTGVAVAIK